MSLPLPKVCQRIKKLHALMGSPGKDTSHGRSLLSCSPSTDYPGTISRESSLPSSRTMLPTTTGTPGPALRRLGRPVSPTYSRCCCGSSKSTLPPPPTNTWRSRCGFYTLGYSIDSL